jgi:hypothetical protein
MMILARHAVNGVNLDWPGRKRCVCVATLTIRGNTGISGHRLLGDDRLCARIIEIGQRRLRRVANAKGGGRMFRLIEGIGNDDGYRLTKEADLIILKYVQPFAGDGVDDPLVRRIGQLWRIQVSYHHTDAGHALDRCAIDRNNTAEPNGRAHDDGVKLGGLIELMSVACAA